VVVFFGDMSVAKVPRWVEVWNVSSALPSGFHSNGRDLPDLGPYFDANTLPPSNTTRKSELWG